jgi:hypothetical protein
MDPNLSFAFSRRALVYMCIGIAFGYLCWGLRAFSATSPATQIETLSAEMEQLKAEIAARLSKDSDTLTGKEEHAAVLEDRAERIANTLRAVVYYDSALSLGQLAGVYIYLIAFWSQIGPVLWLRLRRPWRLP